MSRFRWWPRRRSVVTAWLLSYLIVLFVPIVLSTAVYTQTRATVDEQIRSGNELLLAQMREKIDGQIGSVKRLVAQIYANVEIQSLFYTNKASRGDYLYDLYKVTQDLQGMSSAYTSYDEFYIYWTQGDSVLMPYVYKSADNAYEEWYAGGTMSMDEWRRLVRSTDTRKFIRTSRLNEAGAIVPSVNYVSSFPADENKDSVGTVVVMLDAEQMRRDALNVREFSGGEVFILNGDGEVLVSSLEEGAELPGLDRLKGEQGSFEESFRGEASQYSYIRSVHSDLTYVTVVPNPLVWKESAYVGRLTTVSILFSLLGGLGLTVFFLRRHYRPLGNLVRTLYGGDPAAAGSQGVMNEYLLIEEEWKRNAGERERDRQRFRQQNRELRDSFIVRLLKGRVERRFSREELLAAFDMKFESDRFAVILFDVDGNEAFLERIKEMQPEGGQGLLRFIVSNVAEEWIGRSHAGYMADTGDLFACLACLRPYTPPAEALAELKQAAENTRGFLKQRFQLEASVAISGVHESLSGIAEAYREALETMEYKYVVGDRESSLSYEELERSERLPAAVEGYDYSLQTEQQLINCVLVGDIAKARRTLDEIIERNLRNGEFTTELARCLMFDLVCTFLKTMGELGDVQASFLEKHPKALERLTGLRSVKDIQAGLAEMLEEVCRLTAAKQEANRSRDRDRQLSSFAESIQGYIEEHYEDPNLNITMIGDTFGMKATYLSKLYKDQTGEGLLDAINRTRINRAKELLRTERTSLEEAAGRSGFSSVNTFIRAFKKVEGVTPGQYKWLE